MSKIRFKPYNQESYAEKSLRLCELLPADHCVRFLSDVVSSLDLSPLYAGYTTQGASSYDPLMMSKVLFYAYTTGTYSSRGIEQSLRENIGFMWLSAGQVPDHNTLNRFRLKFKEILPDLFSQTVQMLSERGLVSLEKVYLDGTKWEANVNKYRFVWGKRIAKNKAKLEAQLLEMNAFIARQVAQESPSLCSEHPPQNAQQWSTQIEVWKNLPLNPKNWTTATHKQFKKLLKEAVFRLTNYELAERILAGRNSYAKTDLDATFMRLKEDAMKNGQLKAAYNIQMGTENQLITSYSIHQSSTDFGTLIPHLEASQNIYGGKLKEICADAGYGSEQNYVYLQEKQWDAFVKYPSFYQQSKKSFAKKYPFHQQLLFYNQAQDFFVCPMGQKMHKVGQATRKTANGYLTHLSIYQATNCQGCPLRPRCHQAKGNRKIYYNHNLRKLQKKAKEKLNSDQGVAHRKQRGIDVEAVFGQLKQNWKFRRLSLRSLPKVNLEVGLMAMGHNFRKWYRKWKLEGNTQNTALKIKSTRWWSDFKHFCIRIFWVKIKKLSLIMRQPLFIFVYEINISSHTI